MYKCNLPVKGLNPTIQTFRRLKAILVPLTLLSLACVALSGCYVVPPNVTRASELRTYLAFHGPHTFVVPNTGSMEPYIFGGDRVTVYQHDFTGIVKGERVWFAPSWRKGTIIHVAVRWVGYGWVTQGINTRYPDPQVMTDKNYIGYWEKQP